MHSSIIESKYKFLGSGNQSLSLSEVDYLQKLVPLAMKNKFDYKQSSEA
jgi:hypothetical protein